MSLYYRDDTSGYTYTPGNQSSYHTSSVDLTSQITQTQKFVALIERFGRWPAYLTGDPISSRGNELLIPIIILSSFTILTTLLRGYVRFWLIKSPGWDDACMGAAVACTLTFNAVYGWAVVKGGLGRYEIDIPLEMYFVLFRASFINPILYHPCVGFLKASICLFLLRIATIQWHRRVLWGTMIFSSVFLFAFMVLTACGCDYMDLYYGKRRPGCLSPFIVEKSSFATASVNIVTDLLVVGMPVPVLWNVRIGRRKKGFVRVILGLGVFASVATIVRLILVVVFPPYGNFSRKIDFEIWSVIELNVGITVANIPALAPLIKSYLEKRQTKNSSPPHSLSRKEKIFKPLKSLKAFQITNFSFLGSGTTGSWNSRSTQSRNGSISSDASEKSKGSFDLTSLSGSEELEKSGIVELAGQEVVKDEESVEHNPPAYVAFPPRSKSVIQVRKTTSITMVDDPEQNEMGRSWESLSSPPTDSRWLSDMPEGSDHSIAPVLPEITSPGAGGKKRWRMSVF